MGNERKSALAEQASTRKVVYPKLDAVWHVGKDALTVPKIKELLGWKEEPEKEKWDRFLLKDRDGKKIRCENNVNNRRLYPSKIKEYVQTHLNASWEPNGETIIIGRTGIILDGQHTLIAAVLAEQDRLKQFEKWNIVRGGNNPVTVQKLVAYGVEERDDLINTINTGKPRTFQDIVFRSPYCNSIKDNSRRAALSNALAHAVSILWVRTDVKGDHLHPGIVKTNPEGMNFLERHEDHLIKAAKHILDEESEKSITGSGIGLGAAAAMLYLMGCSSSDGDEYRNQDPRTEDCLDWSNLDQAEKFWVLFSQGRDERFKYLKRNVALSSGLSLKFAWICKAWHAFLNNDPFDDKRLKPEFDPETFQLIVTPSMGGKTGIDVGDPKEPAAEKDPSPEEIKKRAEEEKRKRAADEEAARKKREEQRGELLKRRTNGNGPPKPPEPKPTPTPAGVNGVPPKPKPGGGKPKPGGGKPAPLAGGLGPAPK